MPGGMTVREVLSVIQSLRVPVIGADIVEYNPTRDHHDQTAIVCAKLLKEIAAAMLRKGAPPAADWD
jgi:arginase